jgi:hypothetical protein
MDPVIPSSIPFHVAKAYGLVKSPQVRAVQMSQRLDASGRQGANDATRRLVAAVVPGGIDFSGDHAMPSGASLPMYTNPADRNAAATGVQIGRVLDIQA